MNSEIECILRLLKDVGITAEIGTDGEGHLRITVSVEQFIQSRQWLERWFISLSQQQGYVHLRQRPRGDDDPMESYGGLKIT